MTAFNFSTIDVGVKPLDKEANATAFSFTPEVDGKQAKNGCGEPLVLSILPINSPEGLKEYRKVNIKFGLAELARPHMKANEDDLEALAERDEKSGPEIVARMVKGWNLKQSDGEDIECSVENRSAFFKAFPALALAVMGKIQEASDSLGKT